MPLTRHEQLVILLDNYEDVINGLRDRKGNGDHIPLMCAAWNTPTYQQLERLLRQLKRQEPNLYRHLAGTYIHPEHQRTMTCPTCRKHYPPWKYPSLHTHGRRTTALVPRITRRIPNNISPHQTRNAIHWLDQHWQGPIELPAELQHLAA